MRHLLLLTLLAAPAYADVSRLTWLSGCWHYDGADPGSGEIWLDPVGGSMLAVSRTVDDDRTTGFEFLRISDTVDDSIALYASPSGKPATRFDAVSIGENEVIFENLEHDFPQRIIYRRSGKHLLGRIEGTVDGAAAAVDFPMTRSECFAAGP